MIADNTELSHRMHETQSHSIHWLWYGLGLICALIYGFTTAVVAFNFSLGRMPIALVAWCAFACFLLNTSLKWIDSAYKLSHFFDVLLRKPMSICQANTRATVAIAFTSGFVVLKSYVDQLTLFSQAHHMVIPIWPIATILSLAYSLTAFVLFYDTRQQAPISLAPLRWDIMLFRGVVAMSANTPKQWLAAIASALATLFLCSTTIYCMREMFSIIMPQYAILSSIVSYLVVMLTVSTRVVFYYQCMQRPLAGKGFLFGPTTIKKFFFLSIVLSNGLAHGWIAMASWHAIPAVVIFVVVSINLICSMSVHCVNIDNIFEIQSAFTQQRTRILPLAKAAPS